MQITWLHVMALEEIRPETCQLSVDVKPLVLMRRPGSRAIMARVSYQTNEGCCSQPSLVPRWPSNRPSGLPARCRPNVSVLGPYRMGRGLIFSDDNMVMLWYVCNCVTLLRQVVHSELFMQKSWELPISYLLIFRIQFGVSCIKQAALHVADLLKWLNHSVSS